MSFVITFEGGEGCGKTTQINLLENYFKQKKIDYIKVKEPGGTSLGEDIRNLLLHSKNDITATAELLLFSSSRAQLIERVVKPALKQGKIVIFDRFYDSSFAYQGCAGGVDLDKIKKVTEIALDGLKVDLTIYLDISFEVAMARKAKDENLCQLDRIESKGREYHEKVRAGYLALAKEHKNRIVKVDADDSIENIHSKILSIIEERLKITN